MRAVAGLLASNTCKDWFVRTNQLAPLLLAQLMSSAVPG
jgi:hypothetical protein